MKTSTTIATKKIALIGYGKMGKLIETLIEDSSFELIACIDPQKSSFSSLDQLTVQELQSIDVFIDFSHPAAVLQNAQFCQKHQKALVIGTTGWEEDFEKVQNLASFIPIFFAANFSLGIYLFSKIVGQAAKLFDGLDSYDVAGIEWHHRKKLDQPSGTAKALSQIVQASMQKDLDFTSLRLGYNTGRHEIIFDSELDSISLQHQAKSKQCFAKGALVAAKWLLQQKNGFYGMDDLMEDKRCF